MNILPCDGCGLPASPQHIAERLKRLELSTQFRPVHIAVLFIVRAPAVRVEDDFYGPVVSKEFSEPFLEALEIARSPDKSTLERDIHAAGLARRIEFQRRGYYWACLSECPIPESTQSSASMIAQLAPTLIRRIRFNYKPKYIALIGEPLFPLIDLLKAAGIASSLILSQGRPLPIPRTGDPEGRELFRGAVAAAAHGENPGSGCDRIGLRQSEGDLGAGGGL